MYSQCPECQTRFRVTAEALRAAHGTVRCGRCGSAFDALARLSDSVPSSRETAAGGRNDGAGAAGMPVPDVIAAAEYHFTADDLEKVFIDARDWQKQFGLETPGGPAPTPSGTVEESPADAQVVEVDESERMEDITLEGERISIETPADWPSDDEVLVDLDSTDEFEVLSDVPESAYPEDEETDEAIGLVMGDAEKREPPLGNLADLEPATAPEAVAEAARIAPDQAAEPVAPDAAEAPAAAPATTLAAQRWRRPAEPESSTSTEETPGRGRSGWGAIAWSVGCLLLALVLLAQLTNYYRQDLVRHPQLGPVLRDLYGRLGLPLSPNWDLGAFELRQWGNGGGADTGGRMSIRASLTNRASFAQPHPILRLELDDRYGASIAVRDFEPGEYLKNPSEASRLLDPGASTEADIEIVDPGREAVGYQLDVCLRESAALLRCAQGPG
jgi:predicted Zn finger-like uncharacterized protein